MKYTCKPTSRNELQRIIVDRMAKYGPECDLNDIDTSCITNMRRLFSDEPEGWYTTEKYPELINFNGDISQWNVSNVKDMVYMFDKCKNFNCDLSKWDTSNVEDMAGMFYKCENFNCDLSKWDTSKVTDMSHMFHFCKDFNADISKWDVSKVRNFEYMFWCCEKFNQNIDAWDVSSVIYSRHMFDGCNTTKPCWWEVLHAQHEVYEY